MMATTGWGDESSGSEDEAPVILPVAANEPEATIIQPTSTSSLQQQAAISGRYQDRGGRHAAKKEGNRQERGGRTARGGGGGRAARGGGRQHDDWKTAAKQASILHRVQEPVDGSNWMAQRQKKLQEQKQKDEQLRQEQKKQQELESKERRASQLQALNAAMKTMQQQDDEKPVISSSASSLQQAAGREAKTGVKKQPTRRPSQPKETSWRERATNEGGPVVAVAPRQARGDKQQGEDGSPTTTTTSGRGGRHGNAAEPGTATWRERAAIEESSDDRSKGSRGGARGRGRHRGRGGRGGQVSPNATTVKSVLQKPTDAGSSPVDSNRKQQMKVKNMPDGSIVITKPESSKVDNSSPNDSGAAKGAKGTSSLQNALHPRDEAGGSAGREGRGRGRGRGERGRGRDDSGRGRGGRSEGRDSTSRGRGERGGGRDHSGSRGRAGKSTGRDHSGRSRGETGGGREHSGRT